MTLDLKDKIIIVLVCLSTIVIIGMAVYLKVQQDKYNDNIAKLNNTVAGLSPTVKIDDSTYVKQIQNMQGLLTYLQATNNGMAQQLKNIDAKIISVSNAQIKIKDDISKLDNTKNPTKVIIEKDGSQRHIIDFNQNYWAGYLNLSGQLISNPTAGILTLKTLKEIKITASIYKDKKDGSFKVMVNLPDGIPVSDMVIDGRVDTSIITDEYVAKWYNNFYVFTSFYVSKDGFFIGPSVQFRVGNFLIGPALLINSNATFLYGISAGYNLFGKQ